MYTDKVLVALKTWLTNLQSIYLTFCLLADMSTS